VTRTRFVHYLHAQIHIVEGSSSGHCGKRPIRCVQSLLHNSEHIEPSCHTQAMTGPIEDPAMARTQGLKDAATQQKTGIG
jgi:hypothetical protein